MYLNVTSFVHPSAYESFGIPILEAFVNDCPVLLNNARCFPKVGGDAAIYFDINRMSDLVNHIEAMRRKRKIVIRCPQNHTQIENVPYLQATHTVPYTILGL